MVGIFSLARQEERGPRVNVAPWVDRPVGVDYKKGEGWEELREAFSAANGRIEECDWRHFQARDPSARPHAKLFARLSGPWAEWGVEEVVPWVD